MTNALHQMTMTYVPEQDRLLLRVSTRSRDEHRFWLTRRFVAVLWPALVAALERRAAPTAVPSQRARMAALALEHQEAVQKTDLSQEHDEDGLNRPTTEAPLLVIGGQCRPVRGGGARLDLTTREGVKASLNLTEALVHALCHQLETLTAKADWGLGLTVGDPTVRLTEATGPIH